MNQPDSWHGIFSLTESGVVVSADPGQVSIFDVAPAIAHMLDVPVSENLPGRVPSWEDD